VKFATALLSGMFAPLTEGTARALIRLLGAFVLAVIVFSAGFHYVMALEGRDFTLWSSVYWTIVTMTTLGYGDIVFESDLGRIYSLVVLMSGALLILILLPFTFIQLVYLPWRAAVRSASTPRELPESMSGHILLTGRDPMEESLRARAAAVGVPAILIVEDPEEAVTLQEAGYRVLVGALDDPETYRAAQADQAAMLVTARGDQANTNVAFTMREVTDKGIVVATASSRDSVDVLELAGCDRVIHLGDMLGGAFARRILAPTAKSSIISTFEDLVIAETSAAGTELVGQTLADLDLRDRFGVSVVGVWERGTLRTAEPGLRIEQRSILLLAGTRSQIEAYDASCLDDESTQTAAAGREDAEPVVIIGGGRVGRATARALQQAGTPCRVVEKREERVRHLDDVVIGDAADRRVLEQARIDEASAVVITTHDDDMNIYLTLYARRLRPDVQILGRVNLDRNISTMHRAGADFVLSYATTGATEVWNTMRDDSTLLLAEGLVIFRVPVPSRLAGRSLRSAEIPRKTGCNVIAISRNGDWQTTLDIDEPLPPDAELALIGDDVSEGRFLRRYVASDDASSFRRLVGRLTGAR
jgi:voltage-gated potassium channel